LILEFEFVSRTIIFAKPMILTSFGDGNQTRAFLYVSDWSEATKKNAIHIRAKRRSV